MTAEKLINGIKNISEIENIKNVIKWYELFLSIADGVDIDTVMMDFEKPFKQVEKDFTPEVFKKVISGNNAFVISSEVYNSAYCYELGYFCEQVRKFAEYGVLEGGKTTEKDIIKRIENFKTHHEI